jgi:hypothetical protein
MASVSTSGWPVSDRGSVIGRVPRHQDLLAFGAASGLAVVACGTKRGSCLTVGMRLSHKTVWKRVVIVVGHDDSSQRALVGNGFSSG